MPSIQDLFTPNRAWAAQMEAERSGEVFVHRNVANIVVHSDLNVIEQVVNVCACSVMIDAWAKGQKVNIHGGTFGVDDGLLQDLEMNISDPAELDTFYRAAVDRVWDKRR